MTEPTISTVAAPGALHPPGRRVCRRRGGISKEPKKVVTAKYAVTGDPRDVTVTYTAWQESSSLMSQETVAVLPWTKSLDVQGLVKGGSPTVPAGADQGGDAYAGKGSSSTGIHGESRPSVYSVTRPRTILRTRTSFSCPAASSSRTCSRP